MSHILSGIVLEAAALSALVVIVAALAVAVPDPVPHCGPKAGLKGH